MQRSRVFIALGATVVMAATAMAPLSASAAPKTQAQLLLSGLSSPKGLAINLDGDPVIAQGAFGPPGPVLVHVLRGPDRGSTFEVTEPFNLVDVAISPADGTGWGLGGDQVLYHQLADGTIEAVLNVPAYQVTDPDPADLEGIPEESNPYGLTIAPNGDALVADAAGNDLLRVTPEGDVTTVARFDTEVVVDDQEAEAVPTSVTIGRDGAIYVGELKGAPFVPGSSHVWRIEADAEGAVCSVTIPDPDCAVYADGLTAIQDIAIGRGPRLYVYELAADGVIAFEEGFETGEFPKAVLLEVRGDRHKELAKGEMSQPGGVSVAPDGTVFVTDGVFGDGRLLRIKR